VCGATHWIPKAEPSPNAETIARRTKPTAALARDDFDVNHESVDMTYDANKSMMT
jgi:hypothetical protein